MDDKVKKLYDNLTSDGYKLGTINDFTKGLSDPVKSQKFYQNMTADGYKLGNNFDEFSNNVGLKHPNPPPLFQVVHNQVVVKLQSVIHWITSKVLLLKIRTHQR
jgi:hypothetical protein